MLPSKWQTAALSLAACLALCLVGACSSDDDARHGAKSATSSPTADTTEDTAAQEARFLASVRDGNAPTYGAMSDEELVHEARFVCKLWNELGNTGYSYLTEEKGLPGLESGAFVLSAGQAFCPTLFDYLKDRINSLTSPE